MKNIKFRNIFIFFVFVIFLISIFSVTCFAAGDNGVYLPGDVITFKNQISSDFIPGSIDFNFIDVNTGVPYNRFVVDYRGYLVIEYQFVENDSITYSYTAYSYGLWLNDTIGSIEFSQQIIFTDQWLGFFTVNVDTSSDVVPFYSQIYDLIINNVYGDLELTPDMTLSVSLISTCLSLLVILLPIIVAGFVFIFILKRV